MVVLRHRAIGLGGVDVRVDQRVRENPRRDAGESTEELQDKGIPRDVVRHAERNIAAALREVKVERWLAFAINLNIENVETMARGEFAVVRVAWRPGRDNETPAHRVALDLIDDPLDLIGKGGLSAGVVDGEVPPKIAVCAWDEALFVRPWVPELAVVLLQQPDVRLARQEPQVFDHDVFPRDLFGGEKREALAQIDLVVDIERGERINTGSVNLAGALLECFADSVEVLFHSPRVCPEHAGKSTRRWFLGTLGGPLP